MTPEDVAQLAEVKAALDKTLVAASYCLLVFPDAGGVHFTSNVDPDALIPALERFIEVRRLLGAVDGSA